MKFYTLLGLLAELDNFSLEELLEVKQKVDKLILSKNSNTAAYGNKNILCEAGYYNFDKQFYSNISKIGITEQSSFSSTLISSPNQGNKQSEMQALDSIISLLDKWLKDESGYDEEVYPNIEEGLIRDGNLSFKCDKLFY